MTEQRGTRTVRLDDRTVTYDQAGHGKAIPLLLLHGFAGGRGDFVSVLDGLAADRVVLAPDFPGHGGSEGSEQESAYALAHLAAWVLRLADALRLGDFHLLGRSMGGLVAQRVAASASQRLRSLVLADTGLGAIREEAAERVARFALAVRDEGAEAALAAEGLDRHRDLEPAAIIGGARNLLSAEPVGAFLRGIDIPVLVVHGDGDAHWGPAEAHLLAATVAGAQRVAIPGGGNCPHEERSEAWLSAVRGFLRRAES